MSDEVDTRVSISLDPETFRAIDGYGDETRAFVDCVVNAVNDAHQTLIVAHNARESAESNPSWTPENRIRIVGKEIEGAKQRVLKRFDLADQDLRANIKHTEKALSEPLTEQAGRGTLNTEVRNHAKALKRPERSAFIVEALERDDDLTLAAVLGAPAYLSGLTPVDHEHYLRLYHEKKRPDLVRRLDVMNRFLEKLDHIGPILREQFDKAVGAKPSVVANLRKLEDQTQEALAELRAGPKA